MGVKKREPLPPWHMNLLAAARRRARVRLSSGKIGTLLYVPTPESKGKVRHGDPDQCGVQFDWANPSSVFPVEMIDIVEILPEGAPEDG